MTDDPLQLPGIEEQQIRSATFATPIVGDVEAVFVEAESYFDAKAIRWLRERIIPLVEELEKDANILADLLLMDPEDD